MKWVLIGLFCVFGSATWLRGDAATDLFNQSNQALATGQYDVAAKGFDQLSATYPNAVNINEIRLAAGFAYMHMNDFPNAIDRLAREAGPEAQPKYRGIGLYFTGLAQYSLGQKLGDTDKKASTSSLNDAIATFTTLINLITANPGAGAASYLEDATYYRALAQYRTGNYFAAEKDLVQLLQPAYNSSLKRPDYLFLLGSLYAVETGQAMEAHSDPRNTNKKAPAEIKAIAQKAVDAFDQATRDPNALVQANNAYMSKAEVLYLVAPLDPTGTGYANALDAFHQVRRKDDMVQLQQNHLAELQKAAQNQLQQNTGSASDDYSRLIYREQGRLEELQNATDPIIQALMRIAECYVYLKESDEARTVLHRLTAHASSILTPDQQREVDFEILFSYVLGGQTDKADQALTAYLTKHAGDAQADSISYQIAAKLMDRQDYAGALTQAERSLKDFPKGKFAAESVALKVEALTGLGRIAESDKVVDDFLRQDPTNPVANNMLLVRAQNEVSRDNFTDALADYQKVKDNAAAGEELQSIAAADYIQALRSLNRFDDILTESKNFQAQYPDSKALPGVLFFAALAMDHKSDPGAIAALQDIAQKYPTYDAAPSSLFYLLTIYQRTGNIPAMIQEAQTLDTAYSQKYDFRAKAADIVGKEYLKEKKYDQAVAEYQALINVPSPEIAAAARIETGDAFLAAAKAMGVYQSMPVDTRKDAEKKLSSAEDSYLSTLKSYPDQLNAAGDAFQGLVNSLKQRRSWGLVTDATMEAEFGKLTADLTSPDMQAHVELAKAGLVFVYKNGLKQYPAALARFQKVVAANPSLILSRREADQFGQLLIAGKDYAGATQVYTNLLATGAKDPLIEADAYYGLGAIDLAQGDITKAKDYFSKMVALPDGAAWHPHILDAEFGLAMADEQSDQTADNNKAQATYAALMQESQAGIFLQAKCMIGYGRMLEKAGHGLKAASQGPNEYAVHYYQEPNTIYGPATPEQSAEGLFDAGLVYEKAGDTQNAVDQFTNLINAYRQTAPEWAEKAKAELSKTGQGI